MIAAMGHSGFSIQLRTAGERSPNQRDCRQAEAEQRECRGFGDGGRRRGESCVVADGKGIVVLEVWRCESDGVEGTNELDEPIAFRAVNDGAGRGEGAAGELCGGSATEKVELLTTLGGEVKGRRGTGSTEAPYGEDGIDHRRRKADRFADTRSSLQLNGRRMRRRIAYDTAGKRRGWRPTGNVREAAGLARVRYVDAADGAGGRAGSTGGVLAASSFSFNC